MSGRERGTLPPDLRARLTAARLAAGLSYRQAAEAAGVAFMHVWRIERGERRPSVVVARLLADALHLDAATARALREAAATDAGRSRGGSDVAV